MSNVIISYPNSKGCRFDQEYYRIKHIDLVRSRWERYGLNNVEAYFSFDDSQPFVVMAILQFNDVTSVDAALTSPEAVEIMGDVANFTDIAPTVFIASK